CLHYRSRNVAVADAHREARSDLRNLRRDVREGDVLVDGRAVGPARDRPDRRALVHDLVAVPSHPAVDDEADDPAASAFGLALRDLVPADERLVELARPGEPSLDRVGALVDLVAVDRVGRLGPEGVARTEPDRQEATPAAGSPERRPARPRTLAPGDAPE